MIIKRKPRPNLGDIRTVKRFAFLPVIIDAYTIIWLEFYNSVEEYKLITYWSDSKQKYCSCYEWDAIHALIIK